MFLNVFIFVCERLQCTHERDLNNNTSLVTLDDANAIARNHFKEKTIKVDQQIFEINANREITKTITRLRTAHFDGIKINIENTRTYVK